MKMIIAFAALVAVATSAAIDGQNVQVVAEELADNTGFSDYKYGYQLSNGATKQESAQLVNPGTEDQHYNVVGSFSYVDPATNVQYTVRYTADKDGFHPVGDHIPA
ncbi:flexible cuticle protein 12-like [Neodiprion fabricii]|uniref:flexible cuticle protein 12-like n=1 Tax=Neodiprion fabricii TaxID=2872261 RepID=UPI001ED90BE2|nr:flexible cuticle protein 12-like [Neodiprion fabricii]